MKPRLLDTTLREGEQALGICFSLSEKIIIAQHLKTYGVHIIEIGHPGISPAEEALCTAIANTVNDVDFLVHARACEEDILAAKNTGATWVGIWASFNDISLATKFTNRSREWVIEQTTNTIKLAKKLDLKVRFTIEDASRTDASLIQDIAALVNTAGVDRISLADTVGIWHPRDCFNTVKSLKEQLDCEIECHLHNDLGLAHANAMAALDAGATVIDVSILGIGERAGICDLFSMGASLEQFYGIPFQLQESQRLAEYISRIGKFAIEPHRPLVGRHAFAHTSKYHTKAVVKNPSAYEGLTPEKFGTTRKITTHSLTRVEQQRLCNTLQVGNPFIKGSSELQYHRNGVGTRWVMMDDRIDDRSPIYIIERNFDKDYRDCYESHVDIHAHHCDSVFVFMGNNIDGTGLTVSVTFKTDDCTQTQIITSPASVFIPATIPHSYAYIEGTGRFLNVVLAPNYNKSLLAMIAP